MAVTAAFKHAAEPPRAAPPAPAVAPLGPSAVAGAPLFTPRWVISTAGQAAVHMALTRAGVHLGQKLDSAAPLTTGGPGGAQPSAEPLAGGGKGGSLFEASHVANHLFILSIAQAAAVPLANFAGRPDSQVPPPPPPQKKKEKKKKKR